MSEILATVPYECDDCDTWHLTHYAYENEESATLMEGDEDGNWEPCEEGSSLPSVEEEQEAWKRYYAHVAQSGEDPLGESALKTEHARTRKFIARVAPWIGESLQGVMLIGVTEASHHGRKWRLPDTPDPKPRPIPKDVWDYLHATRANGGRIWTLADFSSIEQLKREATEVRFIPIRDRTGKAPSHWVQFEFEVLCSRPRPKKAIQREHKAWARKQLKEKI